ncbi:MAG: bifunctional 5,10-methylene-tetrahydrofolate dehydrogenase/5,10-methylene-tetrahydrofolate cyclohydrolase [Lachnospiraceae bacterium]|nr:bifunctional 5,10-methylene-tetrahydrofolate dehydrogenase/5,10-methylene-tetrahydrofolate cyclohydrolase [Lachnospiraceae bacterium]
MANILSGKETAASLLRDTYAESSLLREKGVVPALRILRVGARPDDLSYERGVLKKAEAAGIYVSVAVIDDTDPVLAEEELLKKIDEANEDPLVHGILLFRPLPRSMRAHEMEIVERIHPSKDVDGVTRASMLTVYSGRGDGFAPCTPAAVLRILDHYGIDPAGRKTVVVGRSLVVGKPLAMLLLSRNATVTICHTRTKDLAAECAEAGILVTTAGHAGTIRREHVRPGQIVLDVGVDFTPEGKMTGDVVFEEAEPVVGAITPVPGGVGAVTTAVLLSHVTEAAKRQTEV